MSMTRESRWLFGTLAVVILLVVAHDVLRPPAPPAVAALGPVIETWPELRRGMDKTPLLYAEEYARDLALRLEPALVRVEAAAGVPAAGFVTSDDGEIVAALPAGPPPWRVVTARGNLYDVEILGVDRWHGVALLRADLARPARALDWTAPEDAAAGATLLGLHMGRSGPALRAIVAPGSPDVLQARLRDSRLAPGEVLVDLDGRLVGFGARTAEAVRPLLSDALAEIVGALREQGRHPHPWIGAHLQTIDETLRPHFATGDLVAVRVERHSPAEAAGLRDGMAFVEVRSDEQVAITAGDVDRLLAVGRELEFIPAVSGRAPIVVTVADRQWPPGFEPSGGPFGLAVAAADGVAIIVAPGSPAAQAGLLTGDRVEAIDRRAIGSPRELDQALARGGRHLLTIEREGHWFLTVVDAEAGADAAGAGGL